jgi:predicted SnoaL-like aldol condensation-catalyzing enzyme
MAAVNVATDRTDHMCLPPSYVDQWERNAGILPFFSKPIPDPMTAIHIEYDGRFRTPVKLLCHMETSRQKERQMKRFAMSELVVVCGLLTMGGAALVAQSSTMTAAEQANLKFVLDWWREVLQGRHLDLAPKYQAENYIQHNINVPTGRDGFVQFFSRLGPPVNPIPDKVTPPPAVQFAKGDFVALIWEREGKDPADQSKTYKYNTYDLLRMQNGKVQEHWDYAIKTKGTPTGGAPDGIDYDAVKFNLSAQEQKNLEIAIVEFKDILQYGHVELAEQVMAPGYIQHNPNVPTGRAAFVEFFSKIRKPEPIKPEWKNKPTLTIVSGPHVFFMFKRAEKDPDDPNKTYPAYWFDMVRVENGLIQEHWDAAMKTPPAAGRGGN